MNAFRRLVHSGLRLIVAFATLALVMQVSAATGGKSRRAGLGPREPSLKVEYPNSARSRGISQGRAEASVLVDADGKALDFLVTSETDPAFGRALVEELQRLTFQPALSQGVPVPGRCAFSYEFTTQQTVDMNVLDASANRTSLTRPQPVHAAVAEAKLDHPLEILEGTVPSLPKDSPSAGGPVKVSVTFFVDSTGQLRTPSVESAPSPALFAPVIAALSTWKFKAPTAGGKPAVVFAGRTFRLAPAQ